MEISPELRDEWMENWEYSLSLVTDTEDMSASQAEIGHVEDMTGSKTSRSAEGSDIVQSSLNSLPFEHSQEIEEGSELSVTAQDDFQASFRNLSVDSTRTKVSPEASGTE